MILNCYSSLVYKPQCTALVEQNVYSCLFNLQKDTIMSDIEGAQEQIAYLSMENSNLQQAIKKLGLSKAQIAEQVMLHTYSSTPFC